MTSKNRKLHLYKEEKFCLNTLLIKHSFLYIFIFILKLFLLKVLKALMLYSESFCEIEIKLDFDLVDDLNKSPGSRACTHRFVKRIV